MPHLLGTAFCPLPVEYVLLNACLMHLFHYNELTEATALLNILFVNQASLMCKPKLCNLGFLSWAFLEFNQFPFHWINCFAFTSIFPCNNFGLLSDALGKLLPTIWHCHTVLFHLCYMFIIIFIRYQIGCVLQYKHVIMLTCRSRGNALSSILMPEISVKPHQR